VKITMTSTLTQREHTREIEITPAQFRAWQRHVDLLQNVMGELPAEDREFLLTGVTPEEWGEFIGEGEDTDGPTFTDRYADPSVVDTLFGKRQET
jgi:hypothetical protein